MAQTEIKAKVGKGEPVVVKVDLGITLKEYIEKSGDKGEEITLSEARASRIIKLQDVIRAGINAEKSVAEIQKDVNEYSPGVKKRGRSKAEKLKDEFDELDPKEKAALLARLSE
jgi:hypothetical protein|tara:strand:- start:20142 stop:20483 length:342 start_codon:yes stop_codon:yes gene_type:complete